MMRVMSPLDRSTRHLAAEHVDDDSRGLELDQGRPAGDVSHPRAPRGSRVELALSQARHRGACGARCPVPAYLDQVGMLDLSLRRSTSRCTYTIQLGKLLARKASVSKSLMNSVY